MMLGENVKVHFAGIEWEQFYTAIKAADVHYALYSCYKFIVNKSPDDDLTLPDGHLLYALDKTMHHTIQDSGLFTLMFGAKKNTVQTRESLEIWQDKLIKFVQQNRLNVTCVEVDCQKVLGVEDAWYFRRRMRDKLKNRQINVFHFEDGKKGLDRLIEFSDYIAISVPEMRIIKPKTYRQDVKALVHYIKARKPEIDIHLLGCTEVAMLRENAHVTSADSTSWMQGVQYGWITNGMGGKSHINDFNKEVFEKRLADVRAICDERGVVLKGKMTQYTTRVSLCATLCKKQYEKYTGSQE